MVTPTFQSRCTLHRKIAEGVFEFTITKPEGFSFKAGQFIMFLVPLVEKPDDIQPRAFSIASAPEEKELLFIVKIKEGGRAGRWMSEVLREGTEMQLQGPFGEFLLKPGDRPLLFIATCTGMAPLRSLIVDALGHGDTRKMDLIFGVHSEENVFWQKELTELAAQHPQLSLHIALTQPSAAWKGLKGRVQVIAEQVIADLKEREIFACGNPAMLKELKECCFGKWGVNPKDLHVEGYI
ncbi:MAG: FAD-binding oxidoreductase [Candidatus Peribacteraceae bacterium]|nr:FAD-binding oxidoreductase [Candidatus Peribacteraceae bacterium]